MAAELDSWDDTWWGYHTLILTCIEVDMALICPSIPPLRPLLRRCTKFFQKVVSKKRNSSDTVRIIGEPDSPKETPVHANGTDTPPTNALFSLEDQQLRASETIVDDKGAVTVLRHDDDIV